MPFFKRWTLSCLGSDIEYNSYFFITTLDEIAYLKQKDHKQNLEDSEIYRMEISKSPATVSKEEKLVMVSRDSWVLIISLVEI